MRVLDREFAGEQARVRAGVFLPAVAVVLASCATGPKPSDVILARQDPPLLDVPVEFQRILISDDESADELSVPLNERRLVVTPTELTMPGGNGNELTPWEFTLSFATVETVEIKTIRYEPFFPLAANKTFDSAVVVTDKRGRCRRACVFVFTGSDGTVDLDVAERFASIVRTGLATSDPFGRNEGPRPVAAAIGLRAPRPAWSVELRSADAETRKTARAIEKIAFEYAVNPLRQQFRECVLESLNREAIPDPATSTDHYSFHDVSGVGVTRDAKLDVASVQQSEDIATLGANSMLVADIYGMGFRYIPPFDGSPAQAETVFRAYVDFYDIDPLIDGAYFWHTYNHARPLSELAENPLAAIREDVASLCESLSSAVRRELRQH